MKILHHLLLGFVFSVIASTAFGAAGGPDGFGYTFQDSNEPTGPAFAWQDISGTGTPLGLSDDTHAYPINLPFSFDFYGTAYTDIAVGSNGTVYFEDAYLGLSNTPIPSNNSYDVSSFIAGYWDDLNPGSGGEIYHEVVGSAPNRQMIVQWNAVPHFGNSTDTVTYQIILIEGTNDILVNYQDVSSEAGAGATEGIQGDDSTGLEYAFDSAVLTPSLAICYRHPSSSAAACGLGVPPMAVPVNSSWSLLGLVMLILMLTWSGAIRRLI